MARKDCVMRAGGGACDAELAEADCLERYPSCPSNDDLTAAIKIAEVFCLAAPR